MSVQFLQINMNFEAPPDHAALRKKLDLAIDWLHYMPNCWIVKTTSDAQTWYARLKPLLGRHDQIFICKVDLSERQGWMAHALWDWIQKAEPSVRSERVATAPAAQEANTPVSV